MVVLSVLPNEILSMITAHLERPRDVLHLSLANRRLAEFVKLDGWKSLLKGRFGLAGLDSDARNAVHGLTTLYRSWDRRAFVARYLETTRKVTSLNTWKLQEWRGPRGQTMGYQPKIDSFEETLGAWCERKEVLAWSAGTKVVLRYKESGKSANMMWKEREDYGHDLDSPCSFDAFRNRSTWYTYEIPGSFEGYDDITDLKLLRPHQCKQDANALIFGTASGQLSLLSWSTQEEATLEQHFITSARDVRSLSISNSSQPLLAAGLGDASTVPSLALYPVGHDPDDSIEPLSEVTPVIPGAQHGRIWSCSFLSNNKVAIGLGPSYEPIQVYEITPEGFINAPLRTFNLESKFWKGTRTQEALPRNTSIYPILAIPSTSQGGSEAGNTFLSGGYDGIIRLHDMRSPRGFEAMYWDETNDSSIFSLAAQGLERVVAGVSMHSMIKVFDLRFSGSHTYDSRTIKPRSSTRRVDQTYHASVRNAVDDAATLSGGWNLYLNPRTSPKRNAYREEHWRHCNDGPVYSLSIPSSTSTNVYAGLEGTVQNLDFHSIGDTHPDTLHSQSIVHFADSGGIDVRASYNPVGDALNLGMYEQSNEKGLGMQLLVQDGVATNVVKSKERRDAAQAKGLDERWRDLSAAGNRWSRGGGHQGPRRGDGRGRGRDRGGGGRGNFRGRGG